MKQIPLAISHLGVPTFDSFLPGENGAVIEHLRTLTAGAAPVYLWGPSGSGKTHLLRALAAQWQHDGEHVGWFDADTAPPWPTETAWSLLTFDDCHRFDAAQQHAAFALFVQATGAGTLVVASGSVPPVDLPLRDDLRTRLGWGHVFALVALGEEPARAVLRREADRRGIVLGDDVLDYLLTRFERDLKHLMALLDRLDEFALANQRAVTIPLLKQMLLEDRA